MLKSKTKQTYEKIKKNKWKIAAVGGAITTVGLAYLLCSKTSEIKALESELSKEVTNSELVKRVVGGPLIERLIKNEELKLSRVDNRIDNLKSKGMDNKTMKVLREKGLERQNIIETIADFTEVKDALA